MLAPAADLLLTLRILLRLLQGKHKLTLQFANAKHESYGSKFAQTITVTVQ